jgi:hypothetical protein
VARKTPIDRKISRRAAVARRKRDIVKTYLSQEKRPPWKELVAARITTTHRAGVAWCKENAVGKILARGNMIRGTRKGRTHGGRQPIRQEGTKGTKNRDFEDQLRLGSKREFKRPSGGQRDSKSQSKLPNLLSNLKEVNTERCGGADLLRNE